jgi:putative FmdB family regulatory protein
MPLYEFICRNCAHQFERIMKFSDAHPTECPRCGEPRLEQMISAPAVQFKGEGWYVTDYARKKSSASSNSAAKGEGSGDSAPASAAPAADAAKPAAESKPASSSEST